MNWVPWTQKQIDEANAFMTDEEKQQRDDIDRELAQEQEEQYEADYQDYLAREERQENNNNAPTTNN